MSLTGKDPIQRDDTLQLRKVHGYGRAEEYSTQEMFEHFELDRLLPGAGAPQMAVAAALEGTTNPIDFTAATPGVSGNNIKVTITLATFEVGDTDTIKIATSGNTISILVKATGSPLTTTVNVNSLISVLGNDDASKAVATAVLHSGGSGTAKLKNETFELTGGVDAMLANIGKRQIVISNDAFAGEYVCFKPTTIVSATLADHWALINTPIDLT